jgi:hypothetical protein
LGHSDTILPSLSQKYCFLAITPNPPSLSEFINSSINLSIVSILSKGLHAESSITYLKGSLLYHSKNKGILFSAKEDSRDLL